MGKYLEILREFIADAGAEGLQHGLVVCLLTVAFGWVRPLLITIFLMVAYSYSVELYEIIKTWRRARLSNLACDAIGIVVGIFLILLNRMG